MVARVRSEREARAVPPLVTVWAVFGVMLPFGPALGVMVNPVALNVATMVWFADTPVNWYVETAPRCVFVSTTTSAMV